MSRLSCIFGILLLALPTSGLALTPEVIHKIDLLLQSKIARTSPGCAVGILKNHQFEYFKFYGMADVAHSIPNSTETRFELNSTTKQFTGLSLALLALDGKIRFEDSILTYFPEFDARWAGVQVQHLLHHTSGIQDYLDLADATGVSDAELDETRGLQLLHAHPVLKFTPGSQEDYSNSNYFLLSLIVKRVSGLSLGEFAEARIFEPLEMTQTEFLEDRSRAISNLAHGYSRNRQGHLAEDDVKSPIVGDGGVVTTLSDLALWDANFYQNQLGYGPRLLELMRTPGKLNNGQSTDYGLGLVLHKGNGLSWESHAGEYRGYNCQMTRYPQRQLSVIVLCNRTDVDAMALSDQMLAWLL